jgi:hypothetical protein
MEPRDLVGEPLGERFEPFVRGERGAADFGEGGDPSLCTKPAARGERFCEAFLGEPINISFSGDTLTSSSGRKTAGAVRGDLLAIEIFSGLNSRGWALGDELGETMLREVGLRDGGDIGASSRFTCSRALLMKTSVSGSDIHSMRRLLIWRTCS